MAAKEVRYIYIEQRHVVPVLSEGTFIRYTTKPRALKLNSSAIIWVAAYSPVSSFRVVGSAKATSMHDQITSTRFLGVGSST